MTYHSPCKWIIWIPSKTERNILQNRSLIASSWANPFKLRHWNLLITSVRHRNMLIRIRYLTNLAFHYFLPFIRVDILILLVGVAWNMRCRTDFRLNNSYTHAEGRRWSGSWSGEWNAGLINCEICCCTSQMSGESDRPETQRPVQQNQHRDRDNRQIWAGGLEKALAGWRLWGETMEVTV